MAKWTKTTREATLRGCKGVEDSMEAGTNAFPSDHLPSIVARPSSAVFVCCRLGESMYYTKPWGSSSSKHRSGYSGRES